MDKLEIINMSLDHVGLPRAAALEDCDWIAQAIYENSVCDVLRGYPWNFCQKFETFTTATQRPPFGYKYSYNLPVDCLRVIDVRCHQDLRAPKARFSLVSKYLYTNVSPCNVRYVYKELDPDLWRPDFCNVVSLYIAAKIAGKSAQKMELVPQMMQLYNMELARCQAVDARESTERVPLDNSLEMARATRKS